MPGASRGVLTASDRDGSALRHSMVTPTSSPVTLTPPRRNGSCETRLLTVSQACAKSSGAMGRYWVEDMGVSAIGLAGDPYNGSRGSGRQRCRQASRHGRDGYYIN
jgi:hypothetical protein